MSAGTLVILFGILMGVLIFAGTFSFHAALLLPIPCSQGAYCPPPPTDPAVISYRNTVRSLAWVSAIAMDLAVAFAVAMAWIAGGSRGPLPEGTRRGIFVFATVFLVAWLLISSSIFSFLRFLVPFGY
jgi:hypothetical protein